MDAEGKLLVVTCLTWMAAAGCAVALWRPNVPGAGRLPAGALDAVRRGWTAVVRLSPLALLVAAGVQLYGRVGQAALPPVEAAGASLLLLGCAVSVPAGAALLVPPARPGEVVVKGRPWFVGAVVGCVLALAVGTGAVALARWSAAVEHAPASGPAAAVEVPSSLGDDVWQWDPPGDTSVVEVRPTPTGPLVVLNDGAVMLDPRTGEERWHFRVVPERSLPIYGPPDTVGTELLDGGRSVRMHFFTEALGSERVHEVVLDTATGETVPGGSDAQGEFLEPVGNNPTLGISQGPRGTLDRNRRNPDDLLAFTPHGADRPAWQYTGEKGCFPALDGIRFDSYTALVADRTVVVSLMCGDGLKEDEPVTPATDVRDVMVGLDLETGEEVWHHTYNRTEMSGPVEEDHIQYLESAADGSAVLAGASNSETGGPVVEAETGEVLFEGGAEPFWKVGDASAELIEFSATSYLTARCADADGPDAHGKCPKTRYVEKSWSGEVIHRTAGLSTGGHPDALSTAVLDDAVIHAGSVWDGAEASDVTWEMRSFPLDGSAPRELAMKDFDLSAYELLPVPGGVILFCRFSGPDTVVGIS